MFVECVALSYTLPIYIYTIQFYGKSKVKERNIVKRGVDQNSSCCYDYRRVNTFYVYLQEKTVVCAFCVFFHHMNAVESCVEGFPGCSLAIPCSFTLNRVCVKKFFIKRLNFSVGYVYNVTLLLFDVFVLRYSNVIQNKSFLYHQCLFLCFNVLINF